MTYLYILQIKNDGKYLMRVVTTIIKKKKKKEKRNTREDKEGSTRKTVMFNLLLQNKQKTCECLVTSKRFYTVLTL